MPADAPPDPDHLPERWIARSAAAGLDEAARRAHNAAFERREIARHADFFECVLPQPLNDEQRAAIVVDEDATLVVASAGSGKTTLLLGKIAYLVMRGLARPEQIALLAFNNSVRAEIRERLAREHNAVAVHTFHSLGLELVRAARHGACRLSPMASDAGALHAFIADALRAMAHSHPAVLGEWLAAHRHPQRDAQDFATTREWAVWSRRHPPVTLTDKRLRSHALREVVDRLQLAGIPCRLATRWPLTRGIPAYTPDLFLPDVRLALDVRDDPLAMRRGRGSGGNEGVIGRLLRRVGREVLARVVCLRHGLRRVCLGDAWALQHSGALGVQLAARLRRHGLDLSLRALPAVLSGKSAPACLDDTVSRLATCLALQRGGATGGRSDHADAAPWPHGQASVSRAGAPSPESESTDPASTTQRDERRQRAFDALFRHVAAAYAGHLAARGEIDFGDMIAQAARALDGGAVQVPFRYLLVDEFQDISAGRAELVKALRRSRPGMKLLAVGDDWQSIYRFAGSDVSIMAGFESHFGHTETRFLRRTFRFDRRVEAVASAFVLRNPAQIRKQVEAREPDDAAPAVLLWLPPEDMADDPMPGIAAHLLGPPAAASTTVLPTPCAAPPAARLDILILGRYRSLEEQARLDWLAAHYPQADWRFSTIHRAKGATADHAVVLGVRAGRRPFPADQAEDPLLAPFLGAPEVFPHAEERRLFYVALTRARKRVYVVADRRQPSPFFEELLSQPGAVVVCADDGLSRAGRAQDGEWDNLAP